MIFPNEPTEHINTLMSSLISLEHLIQVTPYRIAQVSVIPSIPKGQEEEPIDFISMQTITGKLALKAATSAYKDIYIHPDYSQKSARRTPGAIWYCPHTSPDALNIAELVQRINNAKAAIETFIISTYPTRQLRFEALRQHLPGIMTLHLYRQIRCYLNSGITSVGFTWQQKDSLTRPNKDKLIMQIEQLIEQGSADQILALSQLLSKVSAAPQENLRVRRKVKVQPAANVWSGASLRTVTAPLPILIIQSEPVEIGQLGDFRANKDRKKRTDKAQTQLLGTLAGSSIEVMS